MEKQVKREFKKYANRKIYDLKESRYINLPDLAKLVQSGYHVSVIDNVSGKDVTKDCLVQFLVGKQDLLTMNQLVELVLKVA